MIKKFIEDKKRLRNIYHNITESLDCSAYELESVTKSIVMIYRELSLPRKILICLLNFIVGFCVAFKYFRR